MEALDVVAESITGKDLLVGECKWTTSVKGNKTLQILRNRAALLDNYKVYLYLFTQEKLSDDRLEADITVLTINDFFKD